MFKNVTFQRNVIFVVKEGGAKLEGVEINVNFNPSIGVTDSNGEVKSSFDLTQKLDYAASKANYVIVTGSTIVKDNDGNDNVVNIILEAVCYYLTYF